MKGLFYLVVTMVVIIACTNEEFDANSLRLILQKKLKMRCHQKKLKNCFVI